MSMNKLNQHGLRNYSAIENCLIENKSDIQSCVKESIKHESIDSCYRLTDQIKSQFSKDQVQQYCFYQISEFPTLKSCITHAKKFISPDLHDSAIFTCVMQFQADLTYSHCKQISQNLKYPVKKEHLERQCEKL